MCFQPRVATAEKITGWSEMDKCPYVKVEKSIVHPGEVSPLFKYSFSYATALR